MSRPERILVALLYAMAAISMLAAVPVVVPHSWMAACHHALGLGDLPAMPVIVYLTRSISALYVFHGALLWLVARDIRRYAALITYLGLAFLAFGIVSLGVDIHARLPWFWIAAEGPLLTAIGIAILTLQRLAK